MINNTVQYFSTIRFSSCTNQDMKSFKQVVRVTEWIIRASLPPLKDIDRGQVVIQVQAVLPRQISPGID